MSEGPSHPPPDDSAWEIFFSGKRYIRWLLLPCTLPTLGLLGLLAYLSFEEGEIKTGLIQSLAFFIFAAFNVAIIWPKCGLAIRIVTASIVGLIITAAVDSCRNPPDEPGENGIFHWIIAFLVCLPAFWYTLFGRFTLFSSEPDSDEVEADPESILPPQETED